MDTRKGNPEIRENIIMHIIAVLTGIHTSLKSYKFTVSPNFFFIKNVSREKLTSQISEIVIIYKSMQALQTDFNSLSQKYVLQLIRKHRAISCAELARLTNSRRSTINYILNNLQQADEICVADSPKKGGRGRPAIKFSLNGKRGLVIGFEYSPGVLRCQIMDYSGEVLKQDEYLLKENLKISEVLKRIADIAGQQKRTILGISLALPGIIIQKENKMLFSAPFNEKDVEFPEYIDGIPFSVINDANAGAMVYYWQAEAPHHVLFITANEQYSGLGIGMVLNGEIYEGATGFAGEYGACLPTFDSMLERVPNLKHDFLYSTEIPIIEKLRLLSEQQDDDANHFISLLAEELFVRLLDPVRLINPESLVIGGDFAYLGNRLESIIEPVFKRIMTEGLSLAYQIPAVSISPFRRYSVAAGAAAIAHKDILKL